MRLQSEPGATFLYGTTMESWKRERAGELLFQSPKGSNEPRRVTVLLGYGHHFRVLDRQGPEPSALGVRVDVPRRAILPVWVTRDDVRAGDRAVVRV